MRLVTQLPNDDDITISLDNEETPDDLTEPVGNVQSLSNYLTENKMAAVFPVLTSTCVDSTRNKIIGCSSSQKKTEQLVDASDAVVRNNGFAGKESTVSSDCHEDTRRIQPRNSNGALQSGPRNDDSERTRYEQQDYSNAAERVEHSKGRSSSGFQDKLVTACIEQTNIDTDDEAASASGYVKTCSSDDSENQNSLQEDTFGRKLLQNSVCNSKFSVETKSSRPSNYSLSSDGMPPATRPNAPVQASSDTADATTRERNTLMQKQNIQLTRDVRDGCPNVPVLPKATSLCPSVVSSVAGSGSGQSLIQKTNSQPEVANCDDIITSEVTLRSPEPGRRETHEVLGQNGGRKGRHGLSHRISTRFMNLFQRHATSTPVLSQSARTEGQGRSPKTSGKKDDGKKASRQSSFTGRLMTSVSEWRRKPPNQSKNCSRNRKKKNSDIEETNEPQNNNTGTERKRVPIFVSPQDQAEIVEDAPVGIQEEQKTILRESWLLIKSDVEEVGVETFMGLFHTHPDSIDSFLAFKDKAVEDIEQSAVLKAHALRVMQTVDKCITRLDDADKMAAILCQLGRRHIGYRANATLVPMIGTQFISAIQPKMADKWSNEVGKAWESLFRTINYNLRRGMMQEKHRLQDEATTKKKK